LKLSDLISFEHWVDLFLNCTIPLWAYYDVSYTMTSRTLWRYLGPTYYTDQPPHEDCTETKVNSGRGRRRVETNIWLLTAVKTPSKRGQNAVKLRSKRGQSLTSDHGQNAVETQSKRGQNTVKNTVNLWLLTAVKTRSKRGQNAVKMRSKRGQTRSKHGQNAIKTRSKAVKWRSKRGQNGTKRSQNVLKKRGQNRVKLWPRTRHQPPTI